MNVCYVGKGNNDELVRSVLVDNLGFKLLGKGMQFSNNFRFRWTQTSSEVNYMNFVEGKHIVNHISNSSKILTNKLSTLEVLNELKNNMYIEQVKSEIFKSTDEFVPETYRLDVASDLR